LKNKTFLTHKKQAKKIF